MGSAILNFDNFLGGELTLIPKSKLAAPAKRYYGVKFLPIFALLALQFNLTEQIVVPRYWVSSPLDQAIPFLPVFAVPYVLWFAYIAAGLIFLMLTDQQLFVKTQMYLYLGYEIALLVCLIFPHGQPLRPDMSEYPVNIFTDMVRHIYANDTNTNCLPSIHVLNQLAIHFGLCRSQPFRKHKWIKYTSFIFSALVCASTVLIKQHSIMDVVAALPVSFICYQLVFRVDWGKMKARVFKKTAVAK